VDYVLKKELSPFYIGISGLYEAFFKKVKGLKEVSAAVFKKCKEGDNPLYTKKGGWRNWPKSVEQDDVLEWFNNLIELFLGFVEEYGSVLKI
jgi:hypothetical protein